MKELKEITIGSDNLNLQDNLVKSSILPQVNKELARNIMVQGNVIIEGALFANNLEIINGPAEFKGAVYTHQDFHLNSDARGDIQFDKAVGCASAIVCLAPGAKIYFGADVNGKTVKLKNAFVAGSVIAEEILLEHCVVIGGAFATKTLTLTGCIVGTFNSPVVTAGQVNYLLFPSAFSVEPISLIPGTEFYNLTLADLNSLYKGEPERENTGKILLEMENDTQRTVLLDNNQNALLINSYSVAGKILAADMVDLEKLENHFILNAASLGGQLMKSYTLGDKSNAELNPHNLYEFFFGILDEKIQIQSIRGEFSIEDIKRALT